MDFRYLKAFVASVEQGSFSKAAEELNIAQSAVSRQVKLLEESIDDELLIRSTKHLTLTPKGQKLYEALKHFEAETTNLLKDDERATIRIGIPHGLLESWFQVLLGEYYKTHDTNLTIAVGGLQELREGIEAGRYDLIFTPFAIDSELIKSQAVLDENLAIVSKDAINPEKLMNYRWIIYGPEDLLLKIHRKMPKRVIQVNSITAMIKLVKQGIGIAVLPDHMIFDQKELRSYKKDTLPRQTIFASHLRYRKAPEALQTLLSMLPSP
ncbi:MAG: LysR family transcriptional regulator [Chitinophagaceae bacterium]|nr:LysR family transcriptional regulator [Oligoflexus sp.]